MYEISSNCGKINKSNVVWRCTLIDNDTGVITESQWSKFVVDSIGCHNILTTVMTRTRVDKSTDNTKPHSLC